MLVDFGKCGRTSFRAGIIDRIKSITRGFGKVRHGADNSAEQDHALFIRYRDHRINEFRRRLLAEITGEDQARFISPQTPERASGGASNRWIEVVEKLAQQRKRFRPRADAPAGIGAYPRLSPWRSNSSTVLRGNAAASPTAAATACCRHGPSTTRVSISRTIARAASGPPMTASASRAAACSGTILSRPKPAKRRHNTSSVGMAAAMRRASCFSGQGGTVANPRSAQRGDQAVIVEGIARDYPLGCLTRRPRLRLAGVHAEEVELLGSRHLRAYYLRISSCNRNGCDWSAAARRSAPLPNA